MKSFLMYADYDRQHSVHPAEYVRDEADVAEKDMADFVAGLTVAEIKDLVDKGELSAEEVYEVEMAGKQRAALLKAYEPEEE